MSKAPGRIRDKWRLKEWYQVFTPSYFGELNIANIPCADPSRLLGRVVESTLYEITGDFSHQSIKLYFLVREIKGDRVETILKGHEYSADYLRSLVRRGSSRIDGIFKITTKDGYTSRVSVVAFAKSRVNISQQHAIRRMMCEVLEEKAKALTYDQLCHEMVLGSVAKAGIGSDIYNIGKRISPLRHVGVRKSKLLSQPQVPAPKVAPVAQEAQTA
ncbi:MAG: 30S ribosomal protein S3ae [Candidatus Bathyarchaeota archaeon]|nr:30S ribosomal protein S3ae [Candidatus Bathyarchaeota archaeon]